MIALVTGGTAGIGRRVAENLVAAGLDVLVTGRDADRGLRTAEEMGARFLRAEHGTIAGNLNLADRVLAVAPSLDVLVNNVGGAAFPARTVTTEGHEAIEALNYLGPIALTDALLPALAPGGRVVNVVSSALFMHKGDPFPEPVRYTAIRAYARAKRLNLLATLGLARRLGDAATVNAVNPGMAWTPGTSALTPESVPAWRPIWPVVRFFQRRASAAKAARVPTVLALDPPGTGGYHDGRPKALPAALTDPSLQDAAWNWAVSTTGR